MRSFLAPEANPWVMGWISDGSYCLRSAEARCIVYVDDQTDLTRRYTATASFGAPLSWSPDTKAALPEGHDMSFVEAITGVSENMFLTIAVPDVLLFNLPFKK
jgi:hypothetical protein